MRVALFCLLAVALAAPHISVAYYTNWAQYRRCDEAAYFPEDISSIASQLTHVNYAFAKIDNAGNWAMVEWNDLEMYQRFQNIKAQNPHLKTLISVGGWTWGGDNTCPYFTAMASDSGSRSNFIRQGIDWARQYGFDGVDVDWEYPGQRSRDCNPETDPINYVFLLAEFRREIEAEASRTGQTPLLLTIAAPAGFENIENSKPDQIHEYLDFINVMTYDYYGGSWENNTGHNTPMYDMREEGDLFSINSTMHQYSDQYKVPKEKLVMGFATYGRTWDCSNVADSLISPFETECTGRPGIPTDCVEQDGVIAYYELQRMKSNNPNGFGYDTVNACPYGSNAAKNVWASYDDERSLETKAQYMVDEGFAGAMFWALDMDNFKQGYPLINTVIKYLGDAPPGGDVPPTITCTEVGLFCHGEDFPSWLYSCSTSGAEGANLECPQGTVCQTVSQGDITCV